ncbi:hypothetical protein PsYK624_156780 [Phanerochaete sordida]|uniref:Uncharacterized protein n=1 Tax=Phanerochaete sordida TaxID=48140 RepID=A0A9P3LLC6_9APHY|nr:hypothetical protein PsYK624_156780 [Phanerochaete sordida]
MMEHAQHQSTRVSLRRLPLRSRSQLPPLSAALPLIYTLTRSLAPPSPAHLPSTPLPAPLNRSAGKAWQR